MGVRLRYVDMRFIVRVISMIVIVSIVVMAMVVIVVMMVMRVLRRVPGHNGIPESGAPISWNPLKTL